MSVPAAVLLSLDTWAIAFVLLSTVPPPRHQALAWLAFVAILLVGCSGPVLAVVLS